MKESVRLPIDHITDTAYLVAFWRHIESQRPDAKFHDPYAFLLASPKADLFETILPLYKEAEWLLTVRTCLLDEQIRRLLSQGVDTIVNLAAGLDTRPYRMNLPKSLRWIEVDFPDIVHYKSEKLKNTPANCVVERFALDICDQVARNQLFSYVERLSKKALVITEGLLVYLDAPAVDSLAADLFKSRSVEHWLMDITPPSFFRWMKRRQESKQMTFRGKVEFQFSPEEGAQYFCKFGWNTSAFNSFSLGSLQYNRFLPKEMLLDVGVTRALDDAGIALLSKPIMS